MKINATDLQSMPVADLIVLQRQLADALEDKVLAVSNHLWESPNGSTSAHEYRDAHTDQRSGGTPGFFDTPSLSSVPAQR